MEVQKEDIFHEILEFGVSVVWLGIAFGIAIAGGINAFKDAVGLRTTILESLVVVFFAFVFHELAHRIAARRYGFQAVYHVWIPGLILAMGAALLGFLFAAPGGVHIQIGENTAENRAKLGKSALAGPIVNMVLAVVFAVFTLTFAYFVDSYLTSTGKSLSQLASWVNPVFGICVIGVEINAWLAFFNLIPWGNFDGNKVFQWNKKVWIIIFLGSIALYVLTYFAQTALLG
jgi:Zn-dependent protease